MVDVERKQKSLILKDIQKKMVFIVGPRQVGKTWLAKDIAQGFANPVYLNYDRLEDRAIIKREAWRTATDLLILDEIHKMPGWKNYLKGVFDTRTAHLKIIVTGSARLDFLRQAGDSLTGRFFVHRLLPFSPAEIKGNPLADALDRFMIRGGFPEPFLAEEDVDADRWRLQYVDGLIRTDVLDFERIHDLRAMQIVLELLKTKVGSPISYRSLAEDASIAPNTVRKYIQILEALFIVFRVTPFARNIARSLLKNPKIYFFDTGLVRGDPGAIFENFTALCLLKHVLGKSDALGREQRLHIIRTKEGKEVDFCVAAEGRAEFLVEAKVSEPELSKTLASFSRQLGVPGIQVVQELKRERQEGSLELRRAETYFKELFL